MGTFQIFVRKTGTERHSVLADSFAHAKALYVEGSAKLKDDETTEIHSVVIEGPDGQRIDADSIDLEEERPTDPVAFIRWMVDAWPQFDNDEEVNGGDMVEWFDDARTWGREILRINDATPAVAAAIDGIDAAIKAGEWSDGNGFTKPKPKVEQIKVVTGQDAAEPIDQPPMDPMSDKQMADTMANLEPAPIHPVGDIVFKAIPCGAKFNFTARTDGSYTLRVNGTVRRMYRLRTGENLVDEISLEPGRRHRIAVDFQCENSPVTIMGKNVIIDLPMTPPPSSWVDPLAPFRPSKPMAFEYFEVLPCLENYDGEVESFRSEEDRDVRARQFHPQIPRLFYTLYGLYSGDEAENLTMAIGDFTFKKDALEVMNAILAPMAKARNNLINAEHRAKQTITSEVAAAIYEEAIKLVASDLDDFINQCSNEERA